MLAPIAAIGAARGSSFDPGFGDLTAFCPAFQTAGLRKSSKPRDP
jgi:hypothetical protein